MSNQILVNLTPQEARVALIEQGIVQEIHIERNATRGLVGNIYLGRVCRVLPGMQSAFVEIGLERAGFLHVGDIRGFKYSHVPQQPIEKIISEGQRILVQVIKDPIGTKGARLSTQISLAGRFLVYLPYEDHIGISQKIEDEHEREILKDRLQMLISDDESFKGGFIIRTIAETSTESELKRDINYLNILWKSLCEKAREQSAPSIVYQELDLSLRVLRDFVNEDFDTILVDSEQSFNEMQSFAINYMKEVPKGLQLYSSDLPIFDFYSVESEIEKALARRVDLKSGGYLILDQTEALTTIDVNTGGFVGLHNFDDTIFKTNLEAAQAIARQLRLRNLGGIIIIDFIDMDNHSHQEAVMSEFKKALSRDRTRMSISGFTALGLVEMTRKRTRESLSHILCEPCSYCGGTGEMKTAQTICYAILREILREAKQFKDAKGFKILASDQVIDLFLDEESDSLAQLCELIHKPVLLQCESSYHPEDFDIIII